MNDAPQTDGWLHAIGAALWHELQRLGHGVAIAWHAVTGWPWTPLFVFVVIVVTILGSISYAHRRWKKGWLSGLIDERLSAIRKQRSTTRKRRLRWTDRRLLASELRLTVLETWDKLLDYSKLRFGEQYRDLRFPSPLSFAIIAIIVAAFFFLPRPPQLTAIVHWRLRDWWQLLTADLAGDSARTEGLITGAFTGLAVVVIALIVFVAESIRDNKDPERKKVLVRISYLWPLGVAATLIPFGFLWSASRGSTILLEMIVAGITLVSFARVVHALFDPETQVSDRIKFLQARIRGMIFESVRERIGRSILLEHLGPGLVVRDEVLSIELGPLPVVTQELGAAGG